MKCRLSACASTSLARIPSRVSTSHSSRLAMNAPTVVQIMQKGARDAIAMARPRGSSSGYLTYVRLKGFIGCGVLGGGAEGK